MPSIIECPTCRRPLHVATPGQPIHCGCGAVVEPDKVGRSARRRRVVLVALAASLFSCAAIVLLVAYLVGWIGELAQLLEPAALHNRRAEEDTRDRWPAGGISLAAADPVPLAARQAEEQEFMPDLLKARRAPGKTGPILLEHPNAPYAIAFARAAPIVAVAGQTETRLWNLKTGEIVRSYPGVRDIFNPLALSPDGALLAASDREAATITVWETTHNEVMKTLRSGRAPWALHFSADGKRLVAHLKDRAGNNAVNAPHDGDRSWDLNTWAERVLPIDAGEQGGPIRPDGKYRIVESPYRAYDLADGAKTEIPIAKGSNSCALSHDGRHFALALSGNADVSPLVVYELSTGKHTALGTMKGMASVLQYLPDDAHLFCLVTLPFDAKVGRNRAEYRLLDAATGKQVWSTPVFAGTYAVSPGGKLIAIGCPDGIELWPVDEVIQPR
jgi:WD40 repeat protein